MYAGTGLSTLSRQALVLFFRLILHVLDYKSHFFSVWVVLRLILIYIKMC